jgi:hypothetical protein
LRVRRLAAIIRPRTGEVLVVLLLSLPVPLQVLATVLVLASAPDGRPEAEQCLRRGNEALRNGQVDDAIREYNKAFSIFPSAKLLYNLGQAYEKAGRRQEALDAFKGFVTGLEAAAVTDQGLRERIENARSRVKALESELRPAKLQHAVETRATTLMPPALLARPPRIERLVPPRLVLERQPPAPGPRVSLAPVAEIRSEGARSHARLWWAVGIGAAVVAVATTWLIVSRRGSGCPYEDNPMGACPTFQ